MTTKPTAPMKELFERLVSEGENYSDTLAAIQAYEEGLRALKIAVDNLRDNLGGVTDAYEDEEFLEGEEPPPNFEKDGRQISDFHVHVKHLQEKLQEFDLG